MLGALVVATLDEQTDLLFVLSLEVSAHLRDISAMTNDLPYPYSETPITRQVSQNALLARICVRPPYFALQNTQLEDGLFVAEARAELPQGLALGPMRPGDLSRHGAIAGLCALAMQQKDDQRRYYLATDATFTGYLSQVPYGSLLRFEAEVVELGKRNARAFVTAYAYQERVTTLEVKYSILSALLFERLNAHKRQPTPRATLEPLTVKDIEWRGNTGVYRIPALPVGMCAGHFDNFPTAPVALLMDQLAQIAERFVDRPSYIASGQVSATRLCWAGDKVTFSMTRVGGDVRETQLEGLITSDAVPIGGMSLLLRH